MTRQGQQIIHIGEQQSINIRNRQQSMNENVKIHVRHVIFEIHIENYKKQI